LLTFSLRVPPAIQNFRLLAGECVQVFDAHKDAGRVWDASAKGASRERRQRSTGR